MNVSFHTLTALATAAALAARSEVREPKLPVERNRLLILAAGFIAGLLLHGVLDLLPHAYPIQSGMDVGFSLFLFTIALFFAKPRHRLLIAACFLGAIFPDVFDLGPAILNRHFGWSLPVVKVFPWHWRSYSGSIYDGSKFLESLLMHIAVVGLSLGLLYRFKNALFDSRTDN